MVKFFVCILALLLGGYGYLSIRHPEDAIYLMNFWRFDNFKPSDTYIRRTRIGGVLFILLAVILVVEAFVVF